MSVAKKKLVVLISGSGSNLQTFIDACNTGALPAEISCVISNKADAFGLQRAQKAGIKTEVIDHKGFANRQAFDQVLATRIQGYAPDVVILAGFMRILTTEFVEHFSGKLLNIHPSLLPKYTGLNTHQRAIDAKDEYAGVTVHLVTAELDGGPAILQAKVAISADETAESLAKKVLRQEHIIYPMATLWFLQGRIRIAKEGLTVDQQLLGPSGLMLGADIST